MTDFLTAKDVTRLDDNQGFRRTAEPHTIYAGRGVNTRLFGARPEPDEAALARMAEGVRRHKEIEDGACGFSSVNDWIADMETSCHHEVFVSGNLFELPTVGFLDGVFVHEDGYVTIVDWKFSRSRHFADSPYTEKYKMVQTCYANLLFQFYGLRTREIILLGIHPDTGELNPVTVKRHEFMRYYHLAINSLMDNN